MESLTSLSSSVFQSTDGLEEKIIFPSGMKIKRITTRPINRKVMVNLR